MGSGGTLFSCPVTKINLSDEVLRILPVRLVSWLASPTKTSTSTKCCPILCCSTSPCWSLLLLLCSSLRDAGAVVSYIASLLMLRLDLVTCMFRGWVFFVHVSCLVLITPFVCVGLICICAVVRFSLRCCFVSVSTSFSFFTARQGFQVSTWVCLKLS